jgi:hypothetical protein
MLTTWFTTQVLPAVISAASGAVFGAVVAGWSKLSEKFFLAKLGPSIKTIYNIVDPILDGSLQGWKDSDIDKTIALAIEVVYDGQLTPDEVNKAVRLVSQLWLPQIASEKIEKGIIGEKELTIAEKIRNAVETKSLDAPGLLMALKKNYVG